MNADERGYLNDLAERVIGAAYEVSNVLGAGFLERVYREAMMVELNLRNIPAVAEQPIEVRYKGVSVGPYLADLLVDGKLIVELKCVEAFADEHLAQCLNYLKATGVSLALLINFQKPRVQVNRVVLNF